MVLFYRSFDKEGVEEIRLTREPKSVLADRKPIGKLNNLNKVGYTWQAVGMLGEGILKIRRNAHEIIVTN